VIRSLAAIMILHREVDWQKFVDLGSCTEPAPAMPKIRTPSVYGPLSIPAPFSPSVDQLALVRETVNSCETYVRQGIFKDQPTCVQWNFRYNQMLISNNLTIPTRVLPLTRNCLARVRDTLCRVGWNCD
jgi:hypothetical protein